MATHKIARDTKISATATKNHCVAKRLDRLRVRMRIIDNERANRSIAKTSLIAKMKNSVRLVVGRGRRRSPFALRTHCTGNWLSSTKCLRANATKTVVQRRRRYRKLEENSLFFSFCIHTSSRTRSGKIEIVQIIECTHNDGDDDTPT